MIGFMGFVVAPSLMGFMSGAFGLRAAFAAVALVAIIAPMLARLSTHQCGPLFPFPLKSLGYKKVLQPKVFHITFAA